MAFSMRKLLELQTAMQNSQKEEATTDSCLEQGKKMSKSTKKNRKELVLTLCM